MFAQRQTDEVCRKYREETRNVHAEEVAETQLKDTRREEDSRSRREDTRRATARQAAEACAKVVKLGELARQLGRKTQLEAEVCSTSSAWVIAGQAR